MRTVEAIIAQRPGVPAAHLAHEATVLPVAQYPLLHGRELGRRDELTISICVRGILRKEASLEAWGVP
jgi:uncharacterized protein YcaQ